MSSSNEQTCSAKSRRPYKQRKRAEQQEETRRKIIEATVELHSTLGPARTTISQIAELAGVQRNTFYAHFPDEMELFHACSGLSLERDPLPDPEPWSELPVGDTRLREGLGAIYAWYARNFSLASAVLRDAETHPPTREIVALRFGPFFGRVAEIIGEGLSQPARHLLAVALEFATYRTLSQWHGPKGAAAVMAGAIAAL